MREVICDDIDDYVVSKRMLQLSSQCTDYNECVSKTPEGQCVRDKNKLDSHYWPQGGKGEIRDQFKAYTGLDAWALDFSGIDAADPGVMKGSMEQQRTGEHKGYKWCGMPTPEVVEKDHPPFL